MYFVIRNGKEGGDKKRILVNEFFWKARKTKTIGQFKKKQN